MRYAMPTFVVQEHCSRNHHRDFRLEVAGTLKSWAVPKGPTLDPARKRLAIETPDHDMAYAEYQGIIPAGQYGAGPVKLWDRGTYKALYPPDDPASGLRRGFLSFRLDGKILKGKFTLVRMTRWGSGRQWLLIKTRDPAAKRGWEPSAFLPGIG